MTKQQLNAKRRRKALRRKKVLDARKRGLAVLVTNTHKKTEYICDKKTGKRLEEKIVEKKTSRYKLFKTEALKQKFLKKTA